MSKQPPPAPTASTVGPCPTVIQIVGRPGTGSLPSIIAPPDLPLLRVGKGGLKIMVSGVVGLVIIFTKDSDPCDFLLFPCLRRPI